MEFFFVILALLWNQKNVNLQVKGLKKLLFDFFSYFLSFFYSNVFPFFLLHNDCSICVVKYYIFFQIVFSHYEETNDTNLKKKNFRLYFIRLCSNILCYLHSNRLSFCECSAIVALFILDNKTIRNDEILLSRSLQTVRIVFEMICQYFLGKTSILNSFIMNR